MRVPTLARLRSRAYAARYKVCMRLFSSVAPYYLVNEYPKSGGTWLAQMLADTLHVPFPRNRMLRLERCVTHGHFLNPIGIRKVVVIWRDPRDLLVSLYYHCYFLNEHSNALLVYEMKNRLAFDDYSDIKSNLPAFIRFVSRTPFTPGFTWPEFAAVWARRPGTVQTSYEALRVDTAAEITRIVGELTGTVLVSDTAEAVAERYSFARAKANAESNQTEGVEVSFVREGSIGGWRRYFTKEAEAELDAAGYIESMRMLGYESHTGGRIDQR